MKRQLKMGVRNDRKLLQSKKEKAMYACERKPVPAYAKDFVIPKGKEDDRESERDHSK